jgi:hypothetical protein
MNETVHKGWVNMGPISLPELSFAVDNPQESISFPDRELLKDNKWNLPKKKRGYEIVPPF